MEENKKIKKSEVNENPRGYDSAEIAHHHDPLNQKNLSPDFCFYRTEIGKT